MGEIRLTGCSVVPLGSYLKALGVMKVLAEQADESLLGWWEGGTFSMSTRLTTDEVIAHFINDYAPTPIIAPWNKDSGFFKDEGIATRTVKAIEGSREERFAEYRSVISTIRRIVAKYDVRYENIEAKKESLMIALRNELPDSAVAWMDSAYTVSPEGKGKAKALYPHLLGTGGNDGRLDFAVNFMQNVLDVFGDASGELRLRASLFGEEGSPAAKKSAVGFFYPGGVGGPNATSGFEGDSLVNPWDFVLMLEGALMFAGAASRRLSADSLHPRASFPFSVAVSAVGYASSGMPDEQGTKGSGRGETWLPVWERPTALGELKLVFSEGRASLGRKYASSGVDFARAIASLGVDRGIKGYFRYSFLQRSGKSYIAAPLGFFSTREAFVQGIGLMREIDPWLDSLKRAMGGENVPISKRSALRGLQGSIFEFAVRGDRPSLQGVLVGLGRMEEEASSLPEKEDEPWKKPLPLQGLSPKWVEECDDGSPEFSLAAGLASLRGADGVPLLRHHLEPVEMKDGRLVWSKGRTHKAGNWNDAPKALSALLERICLDHLQAEDTDAQGLMARPAALEAVGLFLRGDTDDSRMLQLLKGLMLVRWPRGQVNKKAGEAVPAWLNRDYVLLKALFLHEKVSLGEAELGFKPELTILNLLRAGRVGSACSEAGRRLRSMMLMPSGDLGLSGINGRRLAAALIFPVDPEAFVRRCMPLVIRKTESGQGGGM